MVTFITCHSLSSRHCVAVFLSVYCI